MTQEFLTKGMNLLNEAVAADNAGDAQKAVNLYVNAIEHLMLAIKYQQSDRIKQTIRNKIDEYVVRVEQLKSQIKTPVAESVTRKKFSNNGASPDDADSAKESLSKAILSERPNVRWEDIAGLENAKEILQETVILPIRCPQMFAGGKRQPWKGILLYGPPGTGKSYLAKAVATEAESTFFSLSPAQLMSKWQGDTEKAIRALFEMAREQRPSVIFIDEVDALCSARGEQDSDSSRRVKNQLLTELDGVGNSMDGVLLLGATNLPWNLDVAMRRRFERKIYIPLPDLKARIDVFRINLAKAKNTLTEQQFQELGKLSEGFSGADISIVVRDAVMEPIRMVMKATHFKPAPGETGMDKGTTKMVPCSPGDEGAQELVWKQIPGPNLLEPDVTDKHFMQAIKRARPSVAVAELGKYEEWTTNFGQEG
jgi:vacuolar protein-sorting-associated protein 4